MYERNIHRKEERDREAAIIAVFVELVYIHKHKHKQKEGQLRFEGLSQRPEVTFVSSLWDLCSVLISKIS